MCTLLAPGSLSLSLSLVGTNLLVERIERYLCTELDAHGNRRAVDAMPLSTYPTAHMTELIYNTALSRRAAADE